MTDEHRDRVSEPVAAGGGAHDITGPEAAEHVGERADASAAAAHGSDAAVHPDAHDDQPLGPIDWAAWRAAVIGIGIAALMVALFYVAIR